jgi:hypothetical protein
VTLGPPPAFTTGRGTTLTTWINYVLCGAQQSAGRLGYSPLPKNLVVGGFLQMGHVPGSIPVPDTTQLMGCNNPTYSDGVNHLIHDAPPPSPCDYRSEPLNCVVQNGRPVTPGNGGSGGSNVGGQSTPGPGGNGSAVGASPGASSSAGVDTDTGQPLGSNNAAGGGAALMARETATRRAADTALTVLTVLELAAALTAPAVLGAWLRRRRTRSSQMGSSG